MKLLTVYYTITAQITSVKIFVGYSFGGNESNWFFLARMYAGLALLSSRSFVIYFTSLRQHFPANFESPFNAVAPNQVASRTFRPKSRRAVERRPNRQTWREKMLSSHGLRAHPFNAGAFALFTLAAAAAAAFSFLNVPVFFCVMSESSKKASETFCSKKKFLRFYRQSSTTFFPLQFVMLPAA
jgi:hypothetical protein